MSSLEESNAGASPCHNLASSPFVRQVVDGFKALQDEICQGLLDLEDDKSKRFHEDLWTREGGGGGRTRVLTGTANDLFEKGGVNFSEVHGEFSEAFAKQIPGSGRAFFATGVSLVIHPTSPHVPTVHANFRHICHGDKSWFGGGADLTPYYYNREDEQHFHQVWRDVCERHPEVANYQKFSEWCDRYFYLPHRKERRGLGGLFFDYLWVDDNLPDERERVWSFIQDAGRQFLAAYTPIAQKKRHLPVTDGQRYWHEIRRGRYAEFNLVHDRGTLFGLKTGGRTESILMSLPPRVRWDYDHQPSPGSPEAALLERVGQEPPPESE